MRRRAQFAGSWYPGDPEELRRFVESAVGGRQPRRAIAAIGPHAGYVYSGGVAGILYGSVEVPDRVVLVSFNHRGRGEDFAVWPEGTWETPLGDVPVDEDLVARILRTAPEARPDCVAFEGEHSGELHVPFLQVRNPRVRIAPLSIDVGLEARGRIEAFGAALASAREKVRDMLVVASTDMSHYDPHEEAVRKDRVALEAMERLDVGALVEAIVRGGVTMCGFGPTIAALAYGRACGARAAEVLDYRTSGDVSGERERVVGYAAVAVWEPGGGAW
jgi:AmmeMemoRadiSam system protein B